VRLIVPVFPAHFTTFSLYGTGFAPFDGAQSRLLICCQKVWFDIKTDMGNPEKIIGSIIAGSLTFKTCQLRSQYFYN
jgi:hypothetical protein